MRVQTTVLVLITVGQNSVVTVDGQLLIRIDGHQHNSWSPYTKHEKLLACDNFELQATELTTVSVDGIVVHEADF